MKKNPSSAKTPVRLFVFSCPTPWGDFYAVHSARGLVSLDFPGCPVRPRAENGTKASAAVLARHKILCRWLCRTLSGRRAALPRALRLDTRRLSPFVRRILGALASFPRGKTLSYAALAEKCGGKHLVRAVARGCGANPFPILIPCHRVIYSNGGLGGFSGGIQWKKRLLVLEKLCQPGPQCI